MQPMCNGGTGHRARVHDFPPGHDQWWSEQVRAGEADVVTADDSGSDGPNAAPVAFHEKRPEAGRGIAEATRDRRADRHDRRRHALRGRFGQNPIYFTGRR
jgi:hypothetical protein